jgi:hypothetical protein
MILRGARRLQTVAAVAVHEGTNEGTQPGLPEKSFVLFVLREARAWSVAVAGTALGTAIAG